MQVDVLRRGVEVVVGTPGRMEDLMNDGILKLNVSATPCRGRLSVVCRPAAAALYDHAAYVQRIQD